MKFQIIAFGNGEILESVLNAIVMCLNPETGTLYTPMIRVGMMVAVLWTALYSIWGDYLKIWGKALIPFVFIPPLLFVPSTRVHIHDVVTNYRNDVENVPLGLAWLGHYVSEFGYQITKQVDQVFARVEDLQYHKSGFLMASNLIQQAKTFHITNEDIAENMRNFVCQCVAYEAMLGYKYTLEDLRHSSDLWGLVSANPSKIRSFVWRQPHKQDEPANPPEIISCKEGVNRLNQIWVPELDRAKTVFGGKLFASSPSLDARKEFIKYLPLSYNFLSGLSKSADQILKQQMMIHSVVDGIEKKSTSLGNAPDFAVRRAYLQQRSTYETLGAMASESLMTMKAVLEAIVYASFIFLVPLAVLPFGVKILLSWAQTLVWLQMWAPLYAILDFIMSMTAQSKSMGMMSVSNREGITIASSVGLTNLNADMAAMAGFLAMSIPFLAIALVKGVGSFVHMASHLGNVSQGAASQAAGEAVTGNYSFGNVSEGNQQIANTNMLSQSRAASYRAGAFQFVDGRTDTTTTADGTPIVNIGSSNLPVIPNISDTISAQESAMATKTYQKGLSQSESSLKSLAESCRSLVSLSDNLAKSESLHDGMTQGVTAEQSKAIHKAAQLIKGFDKDHTMNTDKSASAEAGIGGTVFGITLGAKTSTSASEQDSLRKFEKFSEDKQVQDAMREAMQASQNISHTTSDEEARRLSTDVSGSYEKSMNERYEAQKSFSESDAWNRQAMNTRANAASINANYSQPFFEWLAKQPADNATGHIGRDGAALMIARNPKQAMDYANKFLAQEGLVPKAVLHTNPDKIKADHQAERGHKKYQASQSSINNVKQQGDTAFANHDMPTRGAQFRGGVTQTTDETRQGIDQAASGIPSTGSTIQQKVEAEQGRSITVRMVEKVIDEGKEIVKDLGKIPTKTGDVLGKLEPRNPQQR